jgi:hypothetical protein
MQADKVLTLAMLEVDGAPKLPGLRAPCHNWQANWDWCDNPIILDRGGCVSCHTPVKSKRHKRFYPTHRKCACEGRGWLPIAPQDAAWALTELYRDTLTIWRVDTGWVAEWFGVHNAPLSERPWEAVIAAAYAAEVKE